MKLLFLKKHDKYLFFALPIVACILFILIYASVTTSNRIIWETHSPEEIAAQNREIKPLPESMITIPQYDGRHAKLILEFSMDHFAENRRFEIYNDGSLFYNGNFVKIVPLTRVKEVISRLNALGFYDIHEWGIILKLAGWRQMTILDVLCSRRNETL